MTQHSQQRSTQRAAQAANISASDLWLHYYSVGGNVDVFRLDAYLHGAYFLPAYERNVVALALNELTDDLPHCPKAEFIPNPRAD